MQLLNHTEPPIFHILQSLPVCSSFEEPKFHQFFNDSHRKGWNEGQDVRQKTLSRLLRLSEKRSCLRVL